MDRRSFVTGSAMTAAAVAASGVVPGITLAEQAPDTPAVAAPDAVPAWLGVEPWITDEQIVRTYNCDILIVGAGNAGIVAAQTASEMGLNFIVCDVAPCTAETREYVGAVNTKFTGDVIDKGRLLNELSRYASGKCDRDLIKLWMDESAATVEWIDDIMAPTGKTIQVAPTSDLPMGGTDYYEAQTEHSWQQAYTYPMRDDVCVNMLAEAGHPVLWEHNLVKLVHDENGVHGGIFAIDEGFVQINAAYTILATGGYPANPQMMKALQPDTVRCVTASSFSHFNDGSGIKAAIWAGAAKENDGTPMIFDRGVVAPGVDAGYITREDGHEVFPGDIYQFNIGSQPFLKVNRRGQRFACESTPYDNIAFAAGRQPGGVFCQVFDANAQEDIKRFMTTGCASFTRAMMELGMPVEDHMAMDCGGIRYVQKADTLEELADMLGFAGEDKETFLATCERYNELFDMQEDVDYGKEAYRLSELRTPPFYGTWFGGSLLTTLDGVRINAKMQALDADYNVVPGLYAIGDCSGGFFNTNYPEYYPGVACGRTVTEARMVVKFIAENPAYVATEPDTLVVDELDLSAPAKMADGTYTGSARGMGGTLNVTIDVKDGVISVIEIGPNYETPAYPGAICIANGVFAEQIEAAQSAQIDGVAAATVTTSAIKKALVGAMSQAAAAAM